MKSRSVSAPFVKFIGALCFLALAGCDDADMAMPHVFSGNEVPPEVVAEPRVVPVPPPVDPNTVTYPRLGDVPAKPKNFTPQPLIDATKQEMENDRATGEQLRNAVFPPDGVSK